MKDLLQTLHRLELFSFSINGKFKLLSTFKKQLLTVSEENNDLVPEFFKVIPQLIEKRRQHLLKGKYICCHGSESAIVFDQATGA